MLLINDILFTLFIAAISAAFSYMLDYGFGNPGKKEVSEVNTKALLFKWVFFLAKRRLEKDEIEKIEKEYQYKKFTSKYDFEMNGDRPFAIHVFGIGRELITWEHAAGMCIFCTGLWIALIISAIFYFSNNVYLTFFPNYLILFTTPIFSHFILRKI